MISETDWTILEHANRELTLRFEKLRKVRASRDKNRTKRAEMDYFHALQHLYAAVEDAIAAQNY